jgi:hypothetical protein
MQRALAALLLYNFTTNGLEPRVPLRLKNPNFAEYPLCCCICQFRRAPHCLLGRFCDFHCHCSLLAQTTTLVCWTLVHPSVSCAGAYTSVSWCVSRRSGAYPCYLSVHPVRCASDLEFSADRGRVCITLLPAIAAPTQAAAHARFSPVLQFRIALERIELF